MATTQLPPDFSAFLRLLRRHGVEYLLIGGYAVGFHGYVRATADIDIWIRSTPENAKKTVAALKEFGFDVSELSEDLFLKEDSLIRMGIPPFRIELLTSISGVEFDACWEERVEDKLDGEPVTVISLNDLKVNKRASGRLQDLTDVEKLS